MGITLGALQARNEVAFCCLIRATVDSQEQILCSPVSSWFGYLSIPWLRTDFLPPQDLLECLRNLQVRAEGADSCVTEGGMQ